MPQIPIIKPKPQPESEEYNVVSDLLHIDGKLILGQLDHYINELKLDWKGKSIFLCHVMYNLSDVNSSKLTSTPPLIDICDYIVGHPFKCKNSYFSPIKYPPPQSKIDMSSTYADHFSTCGDSPMSDGQTTCKISRISHSALREAGTTMGLTWWFS
jgi:hypothetical protein